ncbi:unnamed protein product, partial [Meganyctiphanes norvegica]
KIFVLCDCKTGYVLDILLYTGDQTEIERDTAVGMSGGVVLKLLGKFLSRGHVLYIDNWYTSPLLARELFLKDTGVCGTVKKRRKHMPNQVNKLNKKDVIFFSSGNILLTTWMDKREVNMLSTVHKPVVMKTKSIDYTDNRKRVIWKPECVIDYNLNMRLVDQSDAMISSIECARPTMKW